MMTTERSRQLDSLFHACRIYYRGSSITDIKEFEEALRSKLSSGSQFYGRQFRTEGEGVCYDVVIDLEGLHRASDARFLFGLEGDASRLDVSICPGANAADSFLGRQLDEVTRTRDDGHDGRFFGGLRRHGDRDTEVMRSSPVTAVRYSSSGLDELVSFAEGAIKGTGWSRQTLGRAIELQRERVRLRELELIESVMIDAEEKVEDNKEDEEDSNDSSRRKEGDGGSFSGEVAGVRMIEGSVEPTQEIPARVLEHLLAESTGRFP